MNAIESRSPSKKSATITLILCLILGLIGIHRFYVGKKGSGILMLFTLGFLGLWTLIDLLLILTNRFKDKYRQPLILTHSSSLAKKIILILGTLTAWFGIYLALISFILSYTNTALVMLAEKQLTALSNGKIEEAYSYNAESFKKNLSLDNFKNYINKFPMLKNTISTDFPVRNSTNRIGFLVGTLQSKDGTKTPIEYQFIKEGGAWKIVNIKIIPSIKE